MFTITCETGKGGKKRVMVRASSMTDAIKMFEKKYPKYLILEVVQNY